MWNFCFYAVSVIAIVHFYYIHNRNYNNYIYTNFPKGSWVNTMEDPVFNGEILCAYLRTNEKRLVHSCILAKIDTILHNIDGNFVHDCGQNPELCKEELDKEMEKFFNMDWDF